MRRSKECVEDISDEKRIKIGGTRGQPSVKGHHRDRSPTTYLRGYAYSDLPNSDDRECISDRVNRSGATSKDGYR